jgi:hypothetical protein
VSDVPVQVVVAVFATEEGVAVQGIVATGEGAVAAGVV